MYYNSTSAFKSDAPKRHILNTSEYAHNASARLLGAAASTGLDCPRASVVHTYTIDKDLITSTTAAQTSSPSISNMFGLICQLKSLQSHSITVSSTPLSQPPSKLLGITNPRDHRSPSGTYKKNWSWILDRQVEQREALLWFKFEAMDDPVAQIEDVVRSITEPYAASVIATNVEKYFTEDAFIWHPILNQSKARNSREHLKGIYKMLRVTTIKNKIEFRAVMFNSDKTKGAIELTEYLHPRLFPFRKSQIALPFWVRIDLIKGIDGKYRICRQHDVMVNDPRVSHRTFLSCFHIIVNLIKAFNAFICGMLGKFLLDNGYLGAWGFPEWISAFLQLPGKTLTKKMRLTLFVSKSALFAYCM